MNTKVGVIVLLVVAAIGTGASVMSYKRGVTVGMDRYAELAKLNNKRAHDAGGDEGELQGFDAGIKAAKSDYCGYAEMIARASTKKLSHSKN